MGGAGAGMSGQGFTGTKLALQALGNPGSGKSVLLARIEKALNNQYEFITLDADEHIVEVREKGGYSQKVTITVLDAPNGQTKLSCEFEPEITDDTRSGAVYLALKMVQSIHEMGGDR